MKQSLRLTTSQNLVMTQKLQNAIGLLQLPAAELATYVSAHIEQNPFLENPDEQNSILSASSHDSKGSADDADADYHLKMSYGENGASPKTPQDILDAPAYVERFSEKRDLRQHLIAQLPNLSLSLAHQKIAEYMIHMLHPSGYWLENTKAIADKLEIAPEAIDSLLSSLQKLDPTGVFAPDLKTCLTLQLQEKGTCDSIMHEIIENIELLGKYDYGSLLSKLHISPETLQHYLKQIQSLTPKPGEQFSHITPATRIIDVFVTKTDKGFTPILNPEAFPKLNFNHSYAKSLLPSLDKKEDATFVQNCIQEGNWLLKALAQRAETILKVSQAILSHQKDFFTYGIRYLSPLRMQDVAADIGVHESTISRIVNQKFMSTERGVFELKYFFSHKLAHHPQTREVTDKFVKERIKALVDGESTIKPLSDEKICSQLSDEGIQIARRTVAKYRDMLGIPSTSIRRRQKQSWRST